MNLILLFGIVIIVFGLIPIIAIVDIMNSDFRASNAKWIWCTLVVFFPFFGTLLYYWISRNQRVVS